MKEIETHQIYVADLHEYNNGNLRGFWMDIINKTAKEMQKEISDFISQNPSSEEYAIHDYDGVPNLGEYPDLKDIEQVGKVIKDFPSKIIKEYIDQFGIEDLRNIDDRFCGVFETLEDYAYEIIHDCYGDITKAMGDLACYFDYEAFARDLELNGDCFVVEFDYKEVYIFNNY